MRLFLSLILLLVPCLVFANFGDLISSGSLQPLVLDVFPLEEGSNSGIIEENKIIIPEFKIIFQNPSYLLEKDIEKSSYICDKLKDECKVNFKLITLEDKDISSKYLCLIDFGLKNTGEEEKCNPRSVIFLEGEYLVTFKIYDKYDKSNYIEKNINIKNIIKSQNLNNTGSLNSGTGILLNETNTGTIDTSTGIILEQTSTGIVLGTGTIDTSTGVVIVDGTGLLLTGSILKIPEIVIDIQSGLEFLTGSTYKCKKEKCKINLTGENSFLGSFDKKDYICKWSFSGGVYSTAGTQDKCNPGYVNYLAGNYKINLKILEKENIKNYKEKNIFIENNTNTNTESGVVEVNKVIISSGGASKKIENREIIIQSGLSKNSLGYVCENEVCKINLKFQNRYKEYCKWDFGGGNYKEKYLNTCNPGIVYFSPGRYKINLKIYKGEEEVLKSTLNFRNIFKNKANIAPVAKISLQGKLAKYKTFFGNKVVCKGVDKCNINLSGKESFDLNKDNLRFLWDFGNGETSDKNNPLGIWYISGKYKIILSVRDGLGLSSEDVFFVEVVSKTPELDNLVLDNSVFSDIKINKVLVNPLGRDYKEWIEIKNIGKKDINIKGLIIDDILGKGSKEFIIKNDIIIKAGKVKKFYKSDTSLSLGNSKDSINLVYDNRVIDMLSWDFSIPVDYELSSRSLKVFKRNAFVVRVIDGDTILVRFDNGKEERVRLIGIDTPETKHPKKALEYFGKESSDFTKKHLEGKNIVLEQNLENYRDKYKRLLGYVYLGDIFFNKYLIETGYARAYLKYPFKYSVEFENIQKQAKKDRVGLWGRENLKKEILKIIRKENKELNLQKLQEKIIDIKSKKDKKQLIGKENIEIKNIKKELMGEKEKEIIEIEKPLKYIPTQVKKKVNFSQSIAYQKKSLKIYGKTLPNSKIIINIGGKDYNVVSDNTGKYSLKINSLHSGDYKVISKVILKDGGEYLIPREKHISLSLEYLQNMKKYYVKKPVVASSIIEKETIFIPSVNASNKNVQNPKTTINFFLLNIYLGIMVLLMGFLVLKRYKLI